MSQVLTDPNFIWSLKCVPDYPSLLSVVTRDLKINLRLRINVMSVSCWWDVSHVTLYQTNSQSKLFWIKNATYYIYLFFQRKTPIWPLRFQRSSPTNCLKGRISEDHQTLERVDRVREKFKNLELWKPTFSQSRRLSRCDGRHEEVPVRPGAPGRRRVRPHEHRAAARRKNSPERVFAQKCRVRWCASVQLAGTFE